MHQMTNMPAVRNKRCPTGMRKAPGGGCLKNAKSKAFKNQVSVSSYKETTARCMPGYRKKKGVCYRKKNA